tara:strand:+ start:57 stop:320 length:264 start_codon:yes stop_codon:yes gene_type:complete
MEELKGAVNIIKSFEKEYNKLLRYNDTLDQKIQSLENDIKIKKILHKQKIDSLNITIKHQNKKINELYKLIEKYEIKNEINNDMLIS